MNILVVDDNASLVKGLATFLRQEGHQPLTAGTVAAARVLLAKETPDLVVTDLKLPDGEGLEIIRLARQRDNPPEVILMTAFGSVDSAVTAMKLGAMDYLTKPVPLEEFAFRLQRVAALRELNRQTDRLQRANAALLQATGLASPLDDLVGNSPGIREVKELIRKAAAFPSTVLLTGETGTGKEMAARAIHALSPWAEGPFVRVNCASIPDTLFESELFGHEKGAFTDAKERRIGRFEAARGGTLFLDEVGEVPLGLQAKLLRALQEKEIVRVGGGTPIVVETRIVAATNRNLDAMAAQGTFREDLLYRLAVIRIAIPPLRDRTEDLPLLANTLLEKLASDFGRPDLRLDPDTVARLAALPWRGNIRQLRNALERAAVLAEGPILGPEAFSGEFPPHPHPLPPRGARETSGATHPEPLPPQGARETSGAIHPDPLPPQGARDASGAIHPEPLPPQGARGSHVQPLPAEGERAGGAEHPVRGPVGLLAALDARERELIGAALRRAGGVKARAAEELGIPRTNLIYRMKRLGLMPEPTNGV